MGNPVDIIETAEGVPITASQSAAVANLAAQAANTLTGNNTGAPAAAAALTVTQVKTLLAYTANDLALDSAATGVLTWSNATTGAMNPATDIASEYAFTTGYQGGTIPAPAVITVSGTPAYNTTVIIIDRAISQAGTVTIANGAAGGNGGNCGVFAANLTKPRAMEIFFNGTDWIFITFLDLGVLP